MTNRVEGDLLNPSRPPASGYQSRLWKNTRALFLWSGLWGVTCALITLGPRFLWHKVVVFTLLAIGFNACAGIRLIVVHKKYLVALDELQRRVMLNAMAITLGVGLVAGVPYTVLTTLHMIPLKANMGHQWMIMGATYVVSVAYGNWRYR